LYLSNLSSDLNSYLKWSINWCKFRDLLEDAKFRAEQRKRNKGIEAESEEQLRKKRRLNSDDPDSFGLKDAFTLESNIPQTDIQMWEIMTFTTILCYVNLYIKILIIIIFWNRERYIQEKLMEKRKEQYNQSSSSNDGKKDETTPSQELDPFIDKDKILYSTPKNLQGRNDTPQQLGTAGNYSVIEEVTLPEMYVH